VEPPSDQDPKPQNRFENFDLADISKATPPDLPPRRSAIITTAAVVLIVEGLAWGIAGVALASAGLTLGGLSERATTILGVCIGVVLVVAAVGVFTLRPWARIVGIAIGILGVVGAALRVSGGLSTLSTLVVNAFVIYALAVSGSSFRRR
jgi:hypothetical protein